MSGILGRLRLLKTSSGSIWPAQTCRYLAAERTNHVSVTMDPDFDGSVAVVKLQKKPVNSLCSNHLQEITKTITGLENNERVRAMIITSAFPGIFCAGLDLMSMYQRTNDEIYTFWHHFQDMVLKNYTTPLITIAAINGHCVAGGCTIAFGTDYRVMCEDHLTGLNEARLGLPIPFYLKNMTQNLIGKRQAEKMFLLAQFVKSDKALKLGLVDEVVPMDQVLTAAKKQVTKFLEIPDVGRSIVKEGLRKADIEEFNEKRESDAQFYASLNSSPKIQALFQENLENLKKKKK